MLEKSLSSKLAKISGKISYTIILQIDFMEPSLENKLKFATHVPLLLIFK